VKAGNAMEEDMSEKARKERYKKGREGTAEKQGK
jgi:hypothetical protein